MNLTTLFALSELPDIMIFWIVIGILVSALLMKFWNKVMKFILTLIVIVCIVGLLYLIFWKGVFW